MAKLYDLTDVDITHSMTIDPRGENLDLNASGLNETRELNISMSLDNSPKWTMS